MKLKLLSTSLLAGFAFSVNITSAATIVVIAEDFNTAPANTANVTWSDSDGGGFENYGSSGAGPRGMSSTYDHDQNGGTANITIPGGIEVNDDAGAGGVTLTAAINFDLLAPGETVIGDSLTFFTGRRGPNAPDPSITITNMTDATTILATTNLANTVNSTWEFRSFTNLFSDSDAGDTINIAWFGGGNNSASGLQMADVNLTITTAVPEPSSITLIGVAGLGLLLRRRR